jgi:RsiW-degrading membrane proteinase PrsW (M82 family)
MTANSSAGKRQTRTGAVVAIAVTIVCACVTLLVVASAVYTAVFFAADHELDGSAWVVVAWLAILGAISGLATAYLGRRGVRDLRRAPSAAGPDPA